MATQLEIINKVQRRLRETETASVATSAYSQLLGDLLNDVIEEMCAEHDWSQFEATHTVNIDSTTDTYVITGTNNRTELRYIGNQPQVYLFDDSNDTQGIPLTELNKQLWNYFDAQGWSSADPAYFAITKSSTTDNLYIEMMPAPSASRQLRIRAWTPPSPYAVDGSADDTEIYLPENTLVLGTLYLALNERGEEMGEPGMMIEKRYYASLSNNILSDMKNRGQTNEYEMWAD